MYRSFGTILYRTFGCNPLPTAGVLAGRLPHRLSLPTTAFLYLAYMPPATRTKTELLAILTDTFRRLGYDGTSLAALAQATGLGKSSLYHFFPGGKSQMAIEVLEAMAQSLEESLFRPMAAPGSPNEKLRRMLDVVAAFYDNGRKACLLERLTASVDRDQFQSPLRDLFLRWMKALETLARESGVPPAAARARAEDALVRIEGSLIIAAGTGDHMAFARALIAIRRTMLAA